MVGISLLESDILVARVTGPQNRIDDGGLADLVDIVRRVESDASFSGAVITGQGDEYFCSGGPRTASPSVTAGWVHGTRVGFPVHHKPIMAAVNGDALGGGWALALACDGVIATRTATFGSSLVAGFANDDEMALGALLSARLGRQQAKELLYTGRRITCAEAHREALVDSCVTGIDDLLGTALATIRRSG